MTLEYDLLVRQSGKNAEFRIVDRPEGMTDDEYRGVAIEAGKKTKEELGNLGIRNDVILVHVDAPSEEEIQAARTYEDPYYTLDEVLGR